jgi:hypothetical protein
MHVENGRYAMENRRKTNRTCCSLDTAFSLGRETFKGRIENMSNYGAIVLANEPIRISEGKTIRLSIACDGKEEMLDAEVVWSDAKSFGAKFIQGKPTTG